MAKKEDSAKKPLWAQGELIESPKAEKQPLWAQDEIIQPVKSEPAKKNLWEQDEIITPVKPTEDYSVLDFFSDAAKKASASLVSGLAGAPQGIEAAARNIPRDLKDVESVSLPNLLYKGAEQVFKKEKSLITGEPYSFAKEVIGGLQEKEKEKQQLDKVLSSVPHVPGLKEVADWGQQTGQDIRSSLTEHGKQASENSQMSGNLAKSIITNNYSNLSFGKDPSLLGYALNVSDVLGSLGPVVVTAMLTKSPSATAAVGGGMGAGEGVATAKEHIASMSDEQLAQNSPYFATMVKQGMDPAQARKIVTDKAAEYAAQLQGAVATFGGAFTGKLVTGAFDDVLNSYVKSRLGKIAVSGAVSGAEEGTQEFVEGIAADLGINRAVVREVGADSFANFVMGALGGLGPGAYAGVKAKKDEKEKVDNNINQADETVDDEGTRIQTRESYIRTAREKVRAEAAKIREAEEAATKQAEPAAVVEAPVQPVETAAPSSTLDATTLRSLGLRSNTKAFQALDGVDISTPEGRTLFEATIAANQDKVKEDKVTALLASLPPIETEAADATVRPKTRKRADRTSVQTYDERQGDVTTDGAEADLDGTMGGTRDNAGQPTGGAKPSIDTLTALQVGETAQVGDKTYRKTDTGFEIVEDAVEEAEAPVEEAEATVEEVEVKEPEAPESTEVMMSEEELQAEAEAAKLVQQGQNLSRELRTLDPTNPLIEDLLAYDVDEATIADAKAEISNLVRERQSKGQTTQGELRELSEEQKAAEDQAIEDVVDKAFGPKTAPEGEARVKTESEIQTDSAEELARYSELLQKIREEKQRVQDTIDTLDGNMRSPRANIEAAKKPYLDRIAELDQNMADVYATIERVRKEFADASSMAELLLNRDFGAAIALLIKQGHLTEKQAEFYYAIANGDVVTALEYISKFGANSWYKRIATQLDKAKIFPSISFGNLGENTLGIFNAENNVVVFDAGYFFQDPTTHGIANLQETFIHELMHAGTVNSVAKAFPFIDNEPTDAEIDAFGLDALSYLNSKEFKAAENLIAIFDYLKANHADTFNTNRYYGATNPLEMISEAFANRSFQQYLSTIKLPSELAATGGATNIWQKFVDSVKNLLGINVPNSALQRILENGANAVRTESGKATPLESAGRELFYGKYRTPGNVIANKAKKQNIQKLQNKSGIKKPSNNTGKSLFQRIMDFDVKHAMDNLSSAVLSSDNALNNQMRRELEKAGMGWDQIKKILQNLMTSQATHAQNVAHMFLEMGKIAYDPVANMFQVTDNDNGSWGKMMDTIGVIAKQYGMSMDEMELAAHTYFVANRARGIVNRNKQLQKKAIALELAGKRKEADKLLDKLVLVNMTPAQIKAGVDIRKEIPELGQVFEQWHTIRQEVISHLTNTGLYSQEQAAELWDTFDYVPFYREAQIEAKQGPKEFTRGLLDRARQKHIKGSYDPVNNVFDNMNRWITYSIARGINNSQASYTVKAMQQYMVGSISPKPLPPSAKVTPGNLVAVWENGVEKRYRVEDPLIVHYFTGPRAAFAPFINNFAVSGTNKFFRASIILDPIFSLSQVIMDSVTAMFTSSTKFPLKIPVLAVKEFLLTLPNWSKTHKELRAYGAVGETSYSEVSRRMAEEAKYGARSMNMVEKIAETLVKPLRWITTASDNAIRQAVYEQTLKETGDKAQALRAAFEIINFRRAGYSAMVNTVRQSVPFTGAYLQYINVTAKVLTGKGITPEQQKQTYIRLLNSLGQYGLISFMMLMAVGDDDEYKDADNTTRDTRHYIPKVTEKTGIWLPIRHDPFTLVAKMLPEHIYNLSRKEGGEDWTKFKKAFKDYLASALLGPTPMPQLPKTVLQASINYDFNTGRPIVGQGVEGRATEREYSMHTSEIAKRIGSTGIVSPMMVDYWLNNIGGSLSRAFVFLTNAMLRDKEAPEPSTRDKLASFAPKFIKREFGSRGKNDLYELRDVIDEAYATYKDIEKFGTKEQYDKAYDRYIDKVTQKPGIDQMVKQLGQLRDEERMLLESPPGDMTKEQKEQMIRNIRETERIILFDIQFKRDLSGLDKGNPFRKEK